MRRFIASICFLTCCAALLLQNSFDSAAQQKPNDAQIKDNPDSPRKPDDSVLNVWRTTTNNANVRTASVTTNGKIPNGEARMMLRLGCFADSNTISSVDLIVLDAFNIKSFNFSDFEGPDAPAGNKKLVEFRAVSPRGNLSFRVSVAGYYSGASETEGFVFTTYPKTDAKQDKIRRLARMLAEGSTEVTVIVYGYRDNRKTIEAAFPAIAATSDAAETLNGCEKTVKAAKATQRERESDEIWRSRKLRILIKRK
ncbi:MAG: hypothetical protein H7Z37_11235 [Pyrinomonadaceae bacterium]|nr:hypothetical protein [Pyrinomonadaceae bacterium]